MQPVKLLAAISLCGLMSATIIDQIAVVARDAIIKDSDIERDIRVVDFLNQEKLSFDDAARKAAANRLIDQSVIRREIDVGEYRTATDADAERLLEKTQTEQYHSPAVFQSALQKYGLTREQLKQYLRWQLTVLRFIEDRFRPAVLITDDEVAEYYRGHASEFRNASTGQNKTLDESTDEIRSRLTEERVNKQFDSWLNARRRSAKIEYKEEGLK
jgi:hypothetical protein